jgi:hypothetical protein
LRWARLRYEEGTKKGEGEEKTIPKINDEGGIWEDFQTPLNSFWLTMDLKN